MHHKNMSALVYVNTDMTEYPFANSPSGFHSLTINSVKHMAGFQAAEGDSLTRNGCQQKGRCLGGKRKGKYTCRAKSH